MRSTTLVVLVSLLVLGGFLHAKPDCKDESKGEPAFKPIEVKNELKLSDDNDEKINKPAKKYTVKLTKDKAYVVDLTSSAFDPSLRVLDKSGVQLVEDLDGAGDGTSRLVVNPIESGDHQIVVTTF